MISCTSQNSAKLTIAGAANIQFALEALIDSFEIESGITCRSVIGSSGILTAQIMEGADYHVLLSADMYYPNYLFKEGKGYSPENYAYGNLILWTKDEHINLKDSFLFEDNVEHIAAANPETAPYGRAAIEYLKNSGLYDFVYDKIVYGSSISQTNQFIYSGAAEVGFTSKSVIFAPNANIGTWLPVDAEYYTPIEQGMLILKNDQFKSQAEAFRDFLFSKKGSEILTNFGYELP
jgi:molybdate transport system substrate-binding protein